MINWADHDGPESCKYNCKLLLVVFTLDLRAAKFYLAKNVHVKA